MIRVGKARLDIAILAILLASSAGFAQEGVIVKQYDDGSVY